jgi:hypothetical protein
MQATGNGVPPDRGHGGLRPSLAERSEDIFQAVLLGMGQDPHRLPVGGDDEVLLPPQELPDGSRVNP